MMGAFTETSAVTDSSSAELVVEGGGSTLLASAVAVNVIVGIRPGAATQVSIGLGSATAAGARFPSAGLASGVYETSEAVVQLRKGSRGLMWFVLESWRDGSRLKSEDEWECCNQVPHTAEPKIREVHLLSPTTCDCFECMECKADERPTLHDLTTPAHCLCATLAM